MAYTKPTRGWFRREGASAHGRWPRQLGAARGPTRSRALRGLPKCSEQSLTTLCEDLRQCRVCSAVALQCKHPFGVSATSAYNRTRATCLRMAVLNDQQKEHSDVKEHSKLMTQS